jgi:hypothetical protein
MVHVLVAAQYRLSPWRPRQWSLEVARTYAIAGLEVIIFLRDRDRTEMALRCIDERADLIVLLKTQVSWHEGLTLRSVRFRDQGIDRCPAGHKSLEIAFTCSCLDEQTPLATLEQEIHDVLSDWCESTLVGRTTEWLLDPRNAVIAGLCHGSKRCNRETGNSPGIEAAHLLGRSARVLSDIPVHELRRVSHSGRSKKPEQTTF